MRFLFALFSVTVALVTSVATTRCATPENGPEQAAPARPSSFVVLGGGPPMRMELFIEVDDQPVLAEWDAAFDKLFQFSDVDKDGQLNDREAGLLPSPFGIRQILWGKLNSLGGAAPGLAELDADGDKMISRQELSRYYRRAGIGEITVGSGTTPGTDQFNRAIREALDADRDGVVTEAECQQGLSLLRLLDANDDELVTPNELVAKATYPGAAGTTLLRSPTAQAANPHFPVLPLPVDRADTHWASELIRRLDTNRDGSLSCEESRFQPEAFARLDADGSRALSLAEVEDWRGQPADATWHARLRSDDDGKFSVTGSPADASWSNARACIDVRVDSGRLSKQLAAAREQILKQFANADTNADDAVTIEEATSQVPSPMKSLLNAVDRDGDEQISKQELEAWLDVQWSLAKAQVLVTLLDCGEGLWEALDADHDGALSHRELLVVSGRLQAKGCFTDGKLDSVKLPRQFVTVISRGQPATPFGRPLRPGPAWFNAMDRNGDGDVSCREFSGPVEVFDQLDLDKSGLLSANEADKVATP